MAKTFRVARRIDSSRAYARTLLQSIVRYGVVEQSPTDRERTSSDAKPHAGVTVNRVLV